MKISANTLDINIQLRCIGIWLSTYCQATPGPPGPPRSTRTAQVHWYPPGPPRSTRTTRTTQVREHWLGTTRVDQSFPRSMKYHQGLQGTMRATEVHSGLWGPPRTLLKRNQNTHVDIDRLNRVDVDVWRRRGPVTLAELVAVILLAGAQASRDRDGLGRGHTGVAQRPEPQSKTTGGLGG